MKRGVVTAVPIAELVEDMELYPRHAVDDSHVSRLCAALEAGDHLPPVVADKKSKVIVDGWHRVRAFKKMVGVQGVVDVELREYPNRKAMLLDAVQLNSSHGRRLDKIDLTRSVILLRNADVSADKIALVLHCTEARVEKLEIAVATATKTSPGTVSGTNLVTLKRPVRHLIGTKLTKEQAEVHGMLPGTSFVLIARQLRRALETRMVDLGDEKLVAELKSLRQVIGQTVR